LHIFIFIRIFSLAGKIIDLTKEKYDAHKDFIPLFKTGVIYKDTIFFYIIIAKNVRAPVTCLFVPFQHRWNNIKKLIVGAELVLIAAVFAAQTLIGTGRMVLATVLHPEILKDQVCTPAGSTIADVITLEKSFPRGSHLGSRNECIPYV